MKVYAASFLRLKLQVRRKRRKKDAGKTQDEMIRTSVVSWGTAEVVRFADLYQRVVVNFLFIIEGMMCKGANK